jgi:hypothetical protein
MEQSILVTLQKTTKEFLNVSVPLTAELLQPESGDGSKNVDGEKVLKRAVEMGLIANAGWKTEGSSVEVHPTQGLHRD